MCLRSLQLPTVFIVCLFVYLFFASCSLARVMFGSGSLFVLHHPVEFQKKKKEGVKIEEITYDLAQEEIAENSGFSMDKNSGQTKSM